MFLKTGFLRVFGTVGLLWAVGVHAVSGADRAIWRGRVPEAVMQLKAQGQLPATNLLHLTIGLPLRNQPELDQLLHELYDPASPNFRKFITPQEFTARFGPAESDYDTLLEFVRTNGFQIVGTHPNRVLVDVAGTASTVDRVFATTLRKYRHPKEARDFYAPDTDPSVTAPVTLLNVSGLNNYSLPHPNLKLRSLASSLSLVTPQVGSGPGGSYRGNDFRAAYVPGTTLTGAGQSVGLLQYDGYYSNDIAAYISQAGITTSVVLTNIPINGTTTPPPGDGTVEVALDIEMVISMAPGLNKIYVYEGTNGSTSWSSILSKMVNDNLARQLSCSWGGGSPDATSEQLFKQMAAQGQSFFNASGDSDAFTSSVSFPADSTNITQVGGTTLSTSGAGGSYVSETAWNWGNGTGSSGGVSTYYQIPNWQTNISMAANGGSTTYRNIPDVALTGDNVFVIYSNGVPGIFGGTSCAAPLWAGFAALINEQAGLAAKPPVGFLNPALYAMANNASYNNNFHDVTTGNNTSTASPSQYYAVAGYDLCTGLGTPNGTNLINALVPLIYAPVITGSSWSLFAESATPANGAIDPGETVTVRFTLKNAGNLATTNLVATLQSSAGVLAPGGAQTYGALPAFGGTNSQVFTFTAAGICGSNIVATLQLQDGASSLGSVAFTLPLGAVSGLVENFDGVTPPALPSGWATTNVSGTAASWSTSTSVYDTAPNSVFMADSVNPGQNALVSPAIPILSTNAQLSFRHNYALEYNGNVRYDGGVLEIKIGNSAFTDFITAGGSFIANGYNGTITTTSDNPLGGRSAWVRTSSGWKTVTAKLPVSAAGQTVRLRWNCATDTQNGGGSAVGWYVDSVSVIDTVASCLTVLTDIAVSQTLATNSFTPGQNLVYTLTVTNLGPQTAANLVVTDTVPVNAAFVSASSGGAVSTSNVLFSAGMLPAGSSTNFILTLSPVSGNGFTNVVKVATVTPEITTVNNQSTLTSTQVALIAPQINVSPVSQTLECGGNVSYNLNASGTDPLAIQWRVDGVPVFGATNTLLSLTNVHLPSHTVSVVVTNLYGSATNFVSLNVQDTLAPVITLNGGSVLTNELGSAFTDPGAMANDLCAGTLAVTTNGAVNINVIATNTLTYKADDGNGNTNTATRTVIVRDTTPPVVAWSFTNLVLAADTNCSAFMPDVTGTNFILAADFSGVLIISQSPTNNFSLSLGTNMVVIKVQDASSNAVFSTNVIVVLDQAPPMISGQPQSQTNSVGTNANFNVVATACTPLAFQWVFNNGNLSGQTNSTLTLSNLTAAAAGNYFVVATASGGSSTSAVVALTVTLNSPPTIAAVTPLIGGGFALNFAGVAGFTYILETTTNLVSPAGWQPVATNTSTTNGVSQFTDSQATNFPQRFYRLKLSP